MFLLLSGLNDLRMNILWLYDRAPGPGSGGTERISIRLSEGFHSRGHQVEGWLVLPSGSDTFLLDGIHPVTDLPDFLRRRSVSIVICQIGYLSGLLRAFLDAAGPRWRASGGRVIACLHFDPRMPAASPLSLWADSFSLPPARRLRRLVRLALLPLFDKRDALRHRAGFRFTYDRSDAYVLLSDTHRVPFLRMARWSGDTDGRLFSVFNPLCYDTFFSEASLPDKKKILLVVSRLDEGQKRISLILRCWQRLRSAGIGSDWSLRIVGDGPSVASYRRFVANRSLPDVSFTGWCDPLPHYREASLSFTASRAEGWGLTLTESMQQGVIPVAFDTSPVFREIITDGVDGFLLPDADLDQACVLLERLFSDDRLRLRIAANALRSCRRFSLECALDRWELIFKAKIGRAHV